ncbi:hydrolase CocE/NonD family protein, partial [Actinomyces israelii]|uniref:hypothetical protein n=1 Tax=Actinomyces israelii TaxID=1659 RepID=UPI001E3FC617
MRLSYTRCSADANQESRSSCPRMPFCLIPAIPPMAMRWYAGEQLRLLVAGYNMQSPEFNFLAPTKTLNKGRTVLHVGGRYDSHLLAPVLKP